MDSIIDNNLAVNDYVTDTYRVMFRVLKSSFGFHRIWVKDHYIGLHAISEDPPVLEAEALGRQSCHLSDRFLHTEQAFLTSELA